MAPGPASVSCFLSGRIRLPSLYIPWHILHRAVVSKLMFHSPSLLKSAYYISIIYYHKTRIKKRLSSALSAICLFLYAIRSFIPLNNRNPPEAHRLQEGYKVRAHRMQKRPPDKISVYSSYMVPLNMAAVFAFVISKLLISKSVRLPHP